MAFYDHSQQWSSAGVQASLQASWEQQRPPSRPGTSSTGAPHAEPNAFVYQFAEVERAIDNLVKSGKMPFGMFGGGGISPAFGSSSMHRQLEYERPHSTNGLQGFYQNQRYGPRNDQDQMQAAKRRMAAQRERELRNYHQEQQFAKTSTGPKSDRSMSPSTGMSEDERRELIARQHRALYGNEASLYSGDKGARAGSQDVRNLMGPRGGSPLAFDPFSMPGQGGQGDAVQLPQREQQQGGMPGQDAESTTSPAGNGKPAFGTLYDNQQAGRSSNSPPTDVSPPSNGNKHGVAPIGTRPQAGQAPNQALKRSTTPLPSPLSYGFTANEHNANERSTSASSNPQDKASHVSGLGWGSNSGVWGNPKSGLGVQAPVWG